MVVCFFAEVVLRFFGVVFGDFLLKGKNSWEGADGAFSLGNPNAEASNAQLRLLYFAEAVR